MPDGISKVILTPTVKGERLFDKQISLLPALASRRHGGDETQEWRWRKRVSSKAC